ncbi:MAG: hypothetical protein HBSIN02_01310 [Bacteroidia bacterium]|nr:MAG: hypothetical protein HBSIN02_01310 [Bacteroidia bacterium]
MKSTRHLGVSFCNGHIQIAEIEQGKKAVVTALAERETSVDLVQAGIHLSADHPQVATLAGELGDMLRRNKIATRSVSYALPADPTFINIIPLPTSLKGNDLTDFLRWEINQYFPDADPKDFIVDSHPLPSAEKTFHPGFVVGVRRGMVTFLQKVTSELRLQLHLIDVDHLSTEKTISFNYPEIRDHAVGLFSLRMTGMIASLVRNGEIIDYRTYRVEVPDDVPRTISAYLKHVKQKDGIGEPDALFLYGQAVPPDILQAIRNETDTQTLIVNSLRKLPVTGKVYDQFKKENFRFAPAIGLSLRAE